MHLSRHQQHALGVTRRHFFKQCQVGVGAMALSSLLERDAPAASVAVENPMAPKNGHFAGKAKSVIFLHMAGSPSQMDLFDPKPVLNERNGQPCPDSMFQGKRFAFIKGHPKLLGCPHKFVRAGQSGADISELLPHLAEVVDEMAIIRSMNTDQFNHAPAQLFMHTGNSQLGYASMGAWATYGLGTENQDLPGFVVLVSGGKFPSAGKSVWGSGFLPSVYQGVQCRSKGAPVLYVDDPPGMDRAVRRRSLDALGDLNQIKFEQQGDPEILTRIAQYELAFRMQISVPEVMDIRRETQQTLDMYGAKPGEGSFANNCLLARRLVEKGVRFVQLYDWGWDLHGTAKDTDLIHQLPKKCGQTDRPIAALIKDLKQRGLLDETLIVWGGEFGRTSMNEERNGSKLLGRDHHPEAFTMWMAGAGIKGGVTYGTTDDFGYTVTENKVTIRDLQATILHQLGMDAKKLSYPFQGLNQRLIGPEGICQVPAALLS